MGMKSKKILVVEDERLVAEDIAKCLELAGYEVCGIANNGLRALELAEQHRPDLVLEDIVIQGDMNGVDVAIQLKNQFDIPTIFLTAYSKEGIMERAKEAEPLGFITKPFDERSLISTVKLALHKSVVDTQIKESEEWFSTTLNSIGDGVIATDSDGRIQFMNQLAEKLTSWSAAEAEGEDIETVFQISLERTGAYVENPALMAMKDNVVKSPPEGCLLTSRDGQETPIDDSGAPIHDSCGNIIGSVLVFRDISEQRIAERNVKEYQSKLEETVAIRTEELHKRVELERLNNKIASRLLVTDSEAFHHELCVGFGEIAEFLGLCGSGIYQLSSEDDDVSLPLAVYSSNPEELAIAGMSQPGAISLPWFTSQLRNQGKLVLNSIDQLPAEAKFEREILAANQKRAIVLLPLRCDNSVVINFVSEEDREWSEQELIGLESVATVIKNALARQKVEAERKLLQDQLHQSQKLEAIGKLTGGIAHDFNNMLVPIIGYADSILEEADSIEWREEVSEIRKAASSAASLTRQLLAFSRKQILDKKPLTINKEVQDMERMIQRMLGEDVSLKIDTKAKNDIIEADRGQIQQIIVNLCVNARDAMPQGGIITISTHNPEPNKIILKISDTGTGMPPEVLKQAFDPFFSTKGMDGTGLGLSVVLGIVHQHSGIMNLTSEVDVGTHFEISFPLIKESLFSVEEPTSRLRQPTNGNGKKILLVEDEPAVMAFVKMALTKKGFEVVAAANRSQAIKLFDHSEGDFDLVFTDAKLPDGTGIDVLEHVHRKFPKMKALISSGYTDDRALLDQAKSRGVLFLQKPYPLDELFRTINLVLSESASSESLVLPS